MRTMFLQANHIIITFVFQIIAKSIRDLLNLEEPNWNKSISLPPRSELGMTFEPEHEKKQQFGFMTRSNTNQAVQSQKMVRGCNLDLESRGIIVLAL